MIKRVYKSKQGKRVLINVSDNTLPFGQKTSGPEKQVFEQAKQQTQYQYKMVYLSYQKVKSKYMIKYNLFSIWLDSFKEATQFKRKHV